MVKMTISDNIDLTLKCYNEYIWTLHNFYRNIHQADLMTYYTIKYIYQVKGHQNIERPE